MEAGDSSSVAHGASAGATQPRLCFIRWTLSARLLPGDFSRGVRPCSIPDFLTRCVLSILAKTQSLCSTEGSDSCRLLCAVENPVSSRLCATCGGAWRQKWCENHEIRKKTQQAKSYHDHPCDVMRKCPPTNSGPAVDVEEFKIRLILLDSRSDGVGVACTPCEQFASLTSMLQYHVYKFFAACGGTSIVLSGDDFPRDSDLKDENFAVLFSTKGQGVKVSAAPMSTLLGHLKRNTEVSSYTFKTQPPPAFLDMHGVIKTPAGRKSTHITKDRVLMPPYLLDLFNSVLKETGKTIATHMMAIQPSVYKPHFSESLKLSITHLSTGVQFSDVCLKKINWCTYSSDIDLPAGRAMAVLISKESGFTHTFDIVCKKRSVHLPSRAPTVFTVQDDRKMALQIYLSDGTTTHVKFIEVDHAARVQLSTESGATVLLPHSAIVIRQLVRAFKQLIRPLGEVTKSVMLKARNSSEGARLIRRVENIDGVEEEAGPARKRERKE